MNIDINRISCSQYLDVLARVLTCLPQETSICVSQRMQSTRFSFTFCSTGIFDQFEAKPIAWNIHVFVYSLGGRNNVVHEKCKLLPYVVPANFTLTAIRIRAYLDLGDSQHSTATHTQNISTLTVPLCWAHVAVIGRIAWHQFQLDSSNHRDFVSLANSLGAIAAHHYQSRHAVAVSTLHPTISSVKMCYVCIRFIFFPRIDALLTHSYICKLKNRQFNLQPNNVKA